MTEMENWSVQRSNQLYGLDNWGGGYFGINEKGNITVSPDGPEGPKVDLHDLVQQVSQRDIDLPVLFRFNGILRHRVETLNKAFRAAIAEFDYKGEYFSAYPIKVNQQRHIVEILLQAGTKYGMGIEAGSKPELIAVLGIQEAEDSFFLCNGYKDAEYIELALLAKKVGRRPIIIIEKLSELEMILEISKRLGVKPDIGFRIKLSAKGAGRWERSGGERAKFGLTIAEIVQAVNHLKEVGQLEAVRLLHFHLGSQLTSIHSLKVALKEAGQIYVQLKRTCPNLDMLDVGGGLGVDYDGSKTTFASSMNYTLEEYARDVVWSIQDICKKGNVPNPDILTEAGRAMVAHHSVLVFNVLGLASTFGHKANPTEILQKATHSGVQTLAQLMIDLSPKNLQETLHDATALRHDLLAQFNLGLMTIEDRALGDVCYWALLNEIKRHSKEMYYIPEDLERLPGLLTDTYFCNFSVFQSLPDSWAIHQIFPIMPVHRLEEEPTNEVVLADITCDSDGKIDRFADLRDVKRSLPAHELKENEPYYLASFLVGAYQEILGDLHNLFGDTNAVHVEVHPDGRVEFSNVVMGDTVNKVLKYVQYDKHDLCERWRHALERAVTRGSLSPTESAEIYKIYQSAFEGYTYLE
mgnify:CR=1 FL=1